MLVLKGKKIVSRSCPSPQKGTAGACGLPVSGATEMRSQCGVEMLAAMEGGPLRVQADEGLPVPAGRGSARTWRGSRSPSIGRQPRPQSSAAASNGGARTAGWTQRWGAGPGLPLSRRRGGGRVPASEAGTDGWTDGRRRDWRATEGEPALVKTNQKRRGAAVLGDGRPQPLVAPPSTLISWERTRPGDFSSSAVYPSRPGRGAGASLRPRLSPPSPMV